MAEELWRASAVELVAGIRDKRFSCVEVMTSVVERIRALNPTLNAIVVDRSAPALAEAAAADRALASGVEPGPLFIVLRHDRVQVVLPAKSPALGGHAVAALLGRRAARVLTLDEYLDGREVTPVLPDDANNPRLNAGKPAGDARKMRGTKPFLFTNIRAGVGVDKIAAFLVEQGMLTVC